MLIIRLMIVRKGPAVRRFVGVLAALGLAAGGLAAAPVAAADAPPTALKWGPCADPVLSGAGAQCAMLTVPLDYADPSGATVQLAVSRIMHTSPADKYQGVMLVNPGGPGGSGLELSTLGQYVPNGVGADYDWIGFDPRGVGASKPALSCQPNVLGPNRPDYVPDTPELTKTWQDRAQQYAQSCQKANPALLRHMSTIDSARDLDSIRAALGAEAINYYGFSYGTYLGQVYGTLFPQRVRRMVLDSNVDPHNVWYQANLDQDVAFDRNIKIWFAWVAKYDSVYHLGSTEAAVQQVYYQQLKALAAKPAGGDIGPDEWTDIFQQAGYYRFGWTDIGNAFSAWVHKGDASALQRLYQQTDSPGQDNEYAVYLGVQCSDVQWPDTWSRWSDDNWRTYIKAPFDTWGNAWFNAPCLYWPAPAGNPVRVNGSGVDSALLIDETLDAATPYPGSRAVRALFPNSRLIAEPGGTTHADSLFGDACVDNQVAAYLDTGALPARAKGDGPDATCKPLPDPVPPAPSGSSTGKPASPQSGLQQAPPSVLTELAGLLRL
jgi:pimeloyl-ACP methyl ester carboxylesterase